MDNTLLNGTGGIAKFGVLTSTACNLFFVVIILRPYNIKCDKVRLLGAYNISFVPVLRDDICQRRFV